MKIIMRVILLKWEQDLMTYIYRIGYKESKEKLKEKINNKYSFKPRINDL